MARYFKFFLGFKLNKCKIKIIPPDKKKKNLNNISFFFNILSMCFSL